MPPMWWSNSDTPGLKGWETGGVLDERWIRSLHVEALREEELHAEREAHVLFQASTIAALLEGAYDGDLSFAKLAEHGDLGLGTLNGLDGEMVALEGRFYRADVEGRVAEIVRARSVPGQSPPYRPLAEVVASSDLHVELPPGVELGDPGLAAETHAAVELVERAR